MYYVHNFHSQTFHYMSCSLIHCLQRNSFNDLHSHATLHCITIIFISGNYLLVVRLHLFCHIKGFSQWICNFFFRNFDSRIFLFPYTYILVPLNLADLRTVPTSLRLFYDALVLILALSQDYHQS